MAATAPASDPSKPIAPAGYSKAQYLGCLKVIPGIFIIEFTGPTNSGKHQEQFDKAQQAFLQHASKDLNLEIEDVTERYRKWIIEENGGRTRANSGLIEAVAQIIAGKCAVSAAADTAERRYFKSVADDAKLSATKTIVALMGPSPKGYAMPA